MVKKYQTLAQTTRNNVCIQVIRHRQVCEKLQISSAKLFDMIAKNQFAKPFQLIPGGRAVGWIEKQVDDWILERKAKSDSEAA